VTRSPAFLADSVGHYFDVILSADIVGPCVGCRHCQSQNWWLT